MIRYYTWYGVVLRYALVKIGKDSASPKFWLKQIEKGNIMNEKKQDETMADMVGELPKFLKRNQDGTRKEEATPDREPGHGERFLEDEKPKN